MDANKPRVAICTCAKNEEWYINDWLKYHFDLGFNHVYLYDNNDFEDIGKYIDAQFSGKVTIINIHGKRNIQKWIYSWWWDKYRTLYDWVAVIDIDEFVEIVDKTKTIQDVMYEHPEYLNYDNVRLNWEYYIPEKNQFWADLSIPIWERITRKHHEQTHTSKSIVNCKSEKIVSVEAHAALREFRDISECLPNGEQCRPIDVKKVGNAVRVDKLDKSTMYIKHYRTKTLSEYVASKLGRTDPWGDVSTTTKGYFFAWNEKTSEAEKFFDTADVQQVKERLEKTWVNKPKTTIVEEISGVKPFEILCQQTRFDLIYKYMYAKDLTNMFAKAAYLDSILAFNGFNEYEWSGKKATKLIKHGVTDFLLAFDNLIRIAQNGKFKPTPPCVFSPNGVLVSGGHRIAISSVFDLPLEMNMKRSVASGISFPYSMFKSRGLSEYIMDYGALNMVKINPNAYILNVFPVADKGKDREVEEILAKNGIGIYYKKEISGITFNGMVNLNKMFYRKSGKYDSWLGSEIDGFIGAKRHAKRKWRAGEKFRTYVIFCNSLDKIKDVKRQIRQVYGIENTSCHINDFHSEAISIAEILFNANSLHWLNHCKFETDNHRFNQLVDDFKKAVSSMGNSIDDYVLVGSCPLDAYMIRQSKDVDFFFKGDSHKANGLFHPHDSQEKFYPVSKQMIIENPKYHFWYRGVKIISLDAILEMKRCRNERGKDDVDCELINQASHVV